MTEAISFSALGLLGGIISAWVNAKSFKKLIAFESIRFVVLGALIGLVYHFLYSIWNWPNNVMAIIAGYAGTDFIDFLVEKHRIKQNK